MLIASAPRVGHALVDDGLHDRADLVVGDASESVGGDGHDDREDLARQVRAAGGGVVVGGVVETVDGELDGGRLVGVVAELLLQRAAGEDAAAADAVEAVLLVAAAGDVVREDPTGAHVEVVAGEEGYDG